MQQVVGNRYEVTADIEQLLVKENEMEGGRIDDDRRAADIETALANDEVAALVALRGGAWFTRILPKIDFLVLNRRKNVVFVFGFSELTPLINIAGAYERGRGIYDMGPAFLTYGLKLFDSRQRSAIEPPAGSSLLKPIENQKTTPPDASIASVRILQELRSFFHDVIRMIEGHRSERQLLVERIVGDIPDHFEAQFIGGNLSVFSTMIGSRYSNLISPDGKWIVLEDFNDKPERFDRFLSHLTLAGFWERCEGILLGDFHQGDRDLNTAVLSMLKYHLPRNRPVPMLHAPTVGHTWPMSPLPLQIPLILEKHGKTTWQLRS